MSTSTAMPARERILATAKQLFYEEGIRAVGIDKIIERSGVAKMTFYRHFPSKDDLIVAYLAEIDRCHWEWFEAALARHPASPRAQVLDVFDALVEKLTVPEYRGCAFSKVVTEFPDPAHQGRQAALVHSRETLTRLTELARGAGAAAPEPFAEQLALLMEGAYVLAQKGEGAVAAERAREIARLLVEFQLPPNVA